MLLKVLWEHGIVHSDHLVRAAASQMAECLISTCGLSETIISHKIIPALITLASDPEESVRVSTVSPLGAILEYASTSSNPNSTIVTSIVDKVQLQLQSFMEEHQSPNETKFKSQTSRSTAAQGRAFALEIIRVLGRLGPKVDAKFRDEFVLPRLTALAVRNQLSINSDPALKQEFALHLLDAFINVSCCYLSRQVLQEVVLPGLRCLQQDIQTFAPERANIILSMIKEMEDKVEDSNKLHRPARSSNAPPGTQEQSTSKTSAVPHSSGLQATLQLEITKNNLLSKIKDVKEKATNVQITKMFNISKK